MRELLRDRGQTVGRYDSRYLGKDATDAGERPEYDPSYAAVQGTFTEGFNAYVRGSLKFESDMPYEILTGRVQPWNYGQAGSNRFLNVAPALRSAMATNENLRVFVANGYYDLATPYYAVEHTFNHMGLHPEMHKRITWDFYEAGHMLYIDSNSHAKLKHDFSEFVSGSMPKPDSQ